MNDVNELMVCRLLAAMDQKWGRVATPKPKLYIVGSEKPKRRYGNRRAKHATP
ncbi:MAG: hypothetical protein ABI132_12210 [Rhodanobacteraceae bacterium]